MAIADKTFLYRIGTKGAKKAKKDLRGVDKSMERMRLTTTGLQRAVGVLRNKLLLFTFATAGIIGAARAVTKNFIEQENAVTKLEAVLKSTGGVAELTSKQLQVLAAELQKVTSFGDETIITAQSLLLTFTQIGSDVFPQALEAILNVSTAMGTDLQASVLQLGKALNDPILGIAALTRVGIQLSDTQKEQIKLFVEQGNTVGAQKIILGELETQFGGLARAMRNTTEGEITQMTMAFGDMTEAIGEGLAPAIISIAQTLTPMFENLNIFIKAVFGNLSEVEVLQRRIDDFAKNLAKEQGVWKIFQRPEVIEQLTEKIADLRAEIGELLRAAIQIPEGEDMFDLDILDDVKTIMPEISREFAGLEDVLAELTPQQQLFINNIDTMVDGLIQATLYGQRFGDAIVASLKAVAAELIKQAAVFLFMNLFTGGTATLGGFFNFAATGNFPMPPLAKQLVPNDQPNTTVIFQNAVFVGTDEMAIRDTLIPLIDQARANA